MKDIAKPIVFDLDDLCDYWDPYDTLMPWKERNPNGRVTLFAIPRRCSEELLAKYERLDWVQLAIHGWWHTTGECLSWSAEETATKIRHAQSLGFTNGFRAPGWLMTRAVADGCASMGTWVAGHEQHREMWQSGDNIYVYNRKRRGDNWTAVHSHTHDMEQEDMDEAFKSFDFPADSTFKYVSEVVSHVD